MSAAEQTEIKPTSKKKKLIYSLQLLFFGSLFLSLFLTPAPALWSLLSNIQSLGGFAIIWLSLFLPPASPLIIYLLAPNSLITSTLVSLTSATVGIPVLLWWLRILKNDHIDYRVLIYPVFVWLLLGLCFMAYSLIYALVMLGGV